MANTRNTVFRVLAVVVDTQCYHDRAGKKTLKVHVGTARNNSQVNLRLAFSEWKGLKEKEGCSADEDLTFLLLGSPAMLE